ncbi:hypothetical protein AH4AK4_1958 [Aeromonas hydrophila 4AK4]|nr:hypothetical protein AH4AK4_1958 [Aeromonas hydrophila 4AK4]
MGRHYAQASLLRQTGIVDGGNGKGARRRLGDHGCRARPQ